MNKLNLAPILLFTYRRVPTKTIESLLKNSLAKESNLFIFSDGSKNEKDKNDVLTVRNYIKTIKGFKSLKIVESPKNKGLANSIINGVTNIIEQYNKVIVLEDDLIISNDFLSFMNEGLNFYENDKSIWSMAGYSPRLPCLTNYNFDVYLSPRASSWGWATWKDRWDSIDWEAKDFKKLKQDKKKQKQFNIGGNDMYKMLELQMLGKIDSWAIRWCFSQFLQDRYTVFPKKSKIVNDGFTDNKGTHNTGANEKWLINNLNHDNVTFLNLKPQKNIIECFQKYHQLSIFTKIGYFLKKYGGYKIAKRIIKK